MIVQAKASASRRTKNKIREHGPDFDVGREMYNVSGLQGRCVFLKASDGWFGWVVAAEVEVEEKS